MLEILAITHDYIFSKASARKSIDGNQNISDDSPAEDLVNHQQPRPKRGIIIANLDDLHTKKFHSSMLEYQVLLLLHKLLHYSTSYSSQNSKSKIHRIIAKMILRQFKLLIKVLKSKNSSLKSKTICLKIMNILFKTHAKQMTSKLIKVQSLHFIFCSLFPNYVCFGFDFQEE